MDCDFFSRFDSTLSTKKKFVSVWFNTGTKKSVVSFGIFLVLLDSFVYSGVYSDVTPLLPTSSSVVLFQKRVESPYWNTLHGTEKDRIKNKKGPMETTESSLNNPGPGLNKGQIC